MTPNVLTCQELVELVTDYLEEALSPADRERFETHLSTCRHCTAYLAQMRTTIRLTGKLTEADVTPDAEDELLKAFRQWKSTQ